MPTATPIDPNTLVTLTTSLPASTAVIGAATPAPPYASCTYYVTITASNAGAVTAQSSTPPTTWTTNPPAWSVSGIAGSTVTSAGVNSDTSANVYLTIGALAGTTRTNLTLTDATSGGSVQILVTPATLLIQDNFVGGEGPFGGHVVGPFPATNAPTWNQYTTGGSLGAQINPNDFWFDGNGILRAYYQSNNFWWQMDVPNGQPQISNNTNSFITSGIFNRTSVNTYNFANPEIGWGICMDEVNANGYMLSYNGGNNRFDIKIIQGGNVISILNGGINISLVDYNQGTLTPIQFGALNNGDGTTVVWAMIAQNFVTIPLNYAQPVGKFGLLGFQNGNTGGNFGQQYGIAPMSVSQAQVAASGHIVKFPSQPFCALGTNSDLFQVIATPPGCVFGSGVTDAVSLADGTAGGAFKNADGSSLTPIVLSDSNPVGNFRYAPARLTGTNIVASGVSSNSVTMTPSAAGMYCAYDPIKPVGSHAPMISAPTLSGMTPYATSVKPGTNAAQAYTGYWTSDGGPTTAAPQVWGCDLSNLTSGQKAKVLVRIESAMAEGIHDIAGIYNAAPDASVVNYTLEINKVDPAGTPPSDTSSNWIACPAVATPTDYFVPDPNAVSGNAWRVQVHTANMTGANWFRLRCTNGYGSQQDSGGVPRCGMHIEFYDIRNFNTLHDWETGFAGNIFLTDSVGDNSFSFVPGNSYAQAFNAKGYNPLITQFTFPGTHTYDFLPGGAGYAIFQRVLKRSPGRFVNIALATNDLSAYTQDVNCISGLVALAHMCLMAGKVAVVCTPPYASNGSPSPAGAALNSNLDDTTQLPNAGFTGPTLGDQILTVYPNALPWWVAGPDQTTYFRNNPSQMHVSDIHPVGAGVGAWLNNWAASDSANIYSAQAGVQTPTVTSVAVSPSAPSVAGRATQQFTVVVNGANSPAQTVTWSLQSGVGSINPNGLYTAPTATGSAQNAVVQATSTVDNTKFGTSTVTIPAVTITVSGPTSGNDGAVVTLTASGGTTYTWGTDAGTIDSTGHLTLPSTGSNSAHVTATDATGAVGTYTVAYAPASATVSSVTISPTAPSVAGRGTQQFTSSVVGTNSPSQTVTYSLVSGVGSVSAGGLYTAPNASGSAQSATVRATSAQDNTKYANATITVPAVTVTISGASSGYDGATIGLSASGGSSYTWATNIGSIDQSGALTLPSTGSGTAQVTATDSTGALGSYNVFYTPTPSTITSVTVTPGAITLAGAATQQFSASVSGTGSPSQAVTWSLQSGAGSINSSGLYTAPASTGSAQSATVRATSTQDNTKFGTSNVTVNAAGTGSSGSGLTDTQAAQLASVASFISTLHQTGAGLLKAEVDAYAAGEDPVTLLKADSEIKTMIADSNGNYTFTPPSAYPGTGTLTLRDKASASVVGIITLTYDANQNLIQRSVA